MHSQLLDLIDQLIRIFGWTGLIGILVWVIRKWDAGQRDLKTFGDNTKAALETVIVVKAEVEKIKDNHLAHLQEGITKVASSNDKAVELLQDIRTGIGVLVDRTPRV